MYSLGQFILPYLQQAKHRSDSKRVAGGVCENARELAMKLVFGKVVSSAKLLWMARDLGKILLVAAVT